MCDSEDTQRDGNVYLVCDLLCTITRCRDSIHCLVEEDDLLLFQFLYLLRVQVAIVEISLCVTLL